LRKLADLVGYSASYHAEWQMLWAELRQNYPDETTFIPDIARIVKDWCSALISRLEDDNCKSWLDLFLETLKPVGQVKLSIICDDSHKSRTFRTTDECNMKTTWLAPQQIFVITLPTNTVLRDIPASLVFAERLPDIFNDRHSEPRSQSSPVAEDDDWSELTSNADMNSILARSQIILPVQDKSDILPDLQSLPRPEILFRTTIPYILHVNATEGGKVIVSGSHEPSLRLLAQYLQRWIKTDPRDVRKVPAVRIITHESKFGLGPFMDAFTIEPFDHHQNVPINVAVIMAFVQGVLRYSPIVCTLATNRWEFKRDEQYHGS
jgi:hypothetical protein